MIETKSDKKKIAIFPGTFDPFTKGHESIVHRALSFIDTIVIGIGINTQKQSLFSVDTRIDMIGNLFKDEKRVIVESYEMLTIDFARQWNADFIIRGIRSVSDFEYEKSIADTNRKLAGIETLVLFTEPELCHISSSVVRELIRFHRDISEFVPENMNIKNYL